MPRPYTMTDQERGRRAEQAAVTNQKPDVIEKRRAQMIAFLADPDARAERRADIAAGMKRWKRRKRKEMRA